MNTPRCLDCRGSGTYQPLVGPAENCRACDGSGVAGETEAAELATTSESSSSNFKVTGETVYVNGDVVGLLIGPSDRVFAKPPEIHYLGDFSGRWRPLKRYHLRTAPTGVPPALAERIQLRTYDGDFGLQCRHSMIRNRPLRLSINGVAADFQVYFLSDGKTESLLNLRRIP